MSERIPTWPPRASAEIEATAERRRQQIEGAILAWNHAELATTDEEDIKITDPRTGEPPLDIDFDAEMKAGIVREARVAILIDLTQTNAEDVGIKLLCELPDPHERWVITDEWMHELIKNPQKRAIARRVAATVLQTLPPVHEDSLNGDTYTEDDIRYRFFKRLAYSREPVDKESFVRFCEPYLEELDDPEMAERLLSAWDITDHRPFLEAVRAEAPRRPDALERVHVFAKIAEYAESISDIQIAFAYTLSVRRQAITNKWPEDDVRWLDEQVVRILKSAGQRAVNVPHPAHLIPLAQYEAFLELLQSQPRYQQIVSLAYQNAQKARELRERLEM